VPISVAGVAWRDGKMLVARRKPGGVNSRRWEFPGGKVEPGETPQDCLVREFNEELGLSVVVHEFLTQGAFSHRGVHYRLEAYRVEPAGNGTPVLNEHEEVAWLSFEELESLVLVPSDRDIVPGLRAALESDRG